MSFGRRTLTAAQLAKAGNRVTLHGRLSPVDVTNQTVVVSYCTPNDGSGTPVGRLIVLP
jgi:hypothetical protein